MQTDLRQRQLEKAQKRLSHFQNDPHDVESDREARIQAKKAQRMLLNKGTTFNVEESLFNSNGAEDQMLRMNEQSKKIKKRRNHLRENWNSELSVSSQKASTLLPIISQLDTSEMMPEKDYRATQQNDLPNETKKTVETVTTPLSEPVLKKGPKKESLADREKALMAAVPIIIFDDSLYYHTDIYYKYADSIQLLRLYRQYVDADLNCESSLYGYKDLYEYIIANHEIQHTEPENESIYAPLKNGIFVLEEGKLYPNSPDCLTFTYINAQYDPKAKCPVFDSFLWQVTHGNPQLLERFWMAIGYLFIYPARGKFFILMGYARDSGKSVLGNFIQRLYPEESVSNLRLSEMKGTFALMPLLSSVINFELDMPNAKLNSEAISRLKQITGGDSINVQRKYLSPAKLTRRIKFVFASNHPLCIEGEDDALLKRIVYLPFDTSIPDDRQDPDLEEKIWAERDAIVTKALKYAQKLVELNYRFPEIPQVDRAKYSIKDAYSRSVKPFVQECCERCEPNVSTSLEDLYNAYLGYCKEKDEWACSPSDFRETLEKLGLEHHRSRCPNSGMTIYTNPVSAFKGIRLLP